MKKVYCAHARAKDIKVIVGHEDALVQVDGGRCAVCQVEWPYTQDPPKVLLGYVE